MLPSSWPKFVLFDLRFNFLFAIKAQKYFYQSTLSPVFQKDDNHAAGSLISLLIQNENVRTEEQQKFC